MKKLMLFILLTAFVYGDSSIQLNGSFVYDGINRTYEVYLPDDFNPGESLPLMLALHGLTQTGAEMMQFSGFNAVADTGRFVVVYPDGVNNSWNVGFAGGSTADDVGFLSALIDTMQAQYNVNTDRVYMTGFSNGGFMSYRIACELGNRVAAIAPVAGTMTDGALASCSPQRPMPVLHIHGTADLVVNYNGGFGNASVAQVLDYWNGYDNCPANAVIENLPDLVAEGSTVQRQTWSPCDDGSEVMLLKVINGGHTWPGSVGVTGIGNTNRDISASSEIWNFVRRFSLESATGTDLRVSEGLKVYPNPARGTTLTVMSDAPFSSSAGFIYTLQGRVAVEFAVTPGRHSLVVDISGLAPGAYFLSLQGADKAGRTRFIVAAE